MRSLEKSALLLKNKKSKLEHWLHRQWAKRGLFSLVLRPLSLLVSAYTRRKTQQPRASLDFTAPPIIVVGNIIVGGAGKTPVVLALCQFLQEKGWQPGIISRGYGVSIKGKARVGQGQIDPKQFGDEPTLLAQQSGVPVAVHPQRIQALKALCEAHPMLDVIIADDGLQHQALGRDIEIIVQDARGIANGLLLPAGPLRESPARLGQADWLITQLLLGQKPPKTPAPEMPERCITMQLWPKHFEHLASGKKVNATDWLSLIYKDQSCIALAAIGQPVRFFNMLQQFGLTLQKKIALPDHSTLPSATLNQLNAHLLLITAKDAVKYQSINDPRIWVVHVAPQFSPATWLTDVEHRLRTLKTG